MKIKSIFIIVLGFVTFACDEADNKITPDITLLLTLTVEASYPSENSDDWIIVHGEKGDLLASESFENNQELEIITDKPVIGNIMVTHLKYITSAGGSKWYYATSHSKIERGKQMILKGSSNTLPASTGTLDVSVTNVNAVEYYSLSNRVNSSGSASWSGGPNILDMSSATYTGVSKHIVSISDGNSLKYRVLNNVQPNDSYSFSFNDMDPYDHKINFTFPQSDNLTLVVYGSEPDVTLTPNAHMLMLRFLSNTTTVDAGYLNSLTNYKTELKISYPGYAYEYLNLGSVPNGLISWPQKSDFNITNNTLANFSATSSKSYVWRLSSFGYYDTPSKTSIAWTIYSASGQQLIKELPTEITSIHPDLSFNNLVHGSTTFYTESPAFESFVNSYFEAGPEPVGVRMGIKIITN